MLRRVDRFIAPVSWAAAALAVLLLLAGPSLIGAKADKPTRSAAPAPRGKEVFVSDCGGCHTLGRANTSGTVGPNLDELKPDVATVRSTVRSGKGSMPALGERLSGAEIDAVAGFVAGVAPATAKPAATATRTPER